MLMLQNIVAQMLAGHPNSQSIIESAKSFPEGLNISQHTTVSGVGREEAEQHLAEMRKGAADCLGVIEEMAGLLRRH
jgi:hypothetical protein